MNEQRHYFSNGTEFLDWQEVWCFRCRHDHHMTHVSDDKQDVERGCEILTMCAIGDDSHPALRPAGYTILVGDGQHVEIPADGYSIPAAVVCDRFALCERGCCQHPNGALIIGHRETPAVVGGVSGQEEKP